MNRIAICFLFLSLLSCSDDEKIVGKWATNSFSPYYQDTLWISKTDTGIVCKMYHAKGLIKRYYLNRDMSFTIDEMMGCFPFDYTYSLTYSKQNDAVLMSMINNAHGGSPERTASYKRVLGK